MLPANRFGGLLVGVAPSARVYPERTFRYLLDVERARGEAAGQVVVVLMVTLRAAVPEKQRQGVFDQVFAGLTRTIRETDLAGWFRYGRAAGAILTQGPDIDLGRAASVARCAMERFEQVLESPAWCQIRIRSLVLGAGTKEVMDDD